MLSNHVPVSSSVMGGKGHQKGKVSPSSPRKVLFFFTCFSVSFKMQVLLEEMVHSKIAVRFNRLVSDLYAEQISVGKALELRTLNTWKGDSVKREGLEIKGGGEGGFLPFFTVLLKADLRYTYFYTPPHPVNFSLINTGPVKAHTCLSLSSWRVFLSWCLIKFYSIALNNCIIIEKALCHFPFLKYIMLAKFVSPHLFLETANLLDL